MFWEFYFEKPLWQTFSLFFETLLGTEVLSPVFSFFLARVLRKIAGLEQWMLRADLLFFFGGSFSLGMTPTYFLIACYAVLISLN